ncbi:MAG: alpha/beta fold hydrolase [Paracoccaceae bacterium]
MRCLTSILLRATSVGVLAGALMTAFPSTSAAQVENNEVQVPFLTLRNLAEGDGGERHFGNERSHLRAGWCRVRDLELGSIAPLADSAPGFIREQLLRVDEIRVTRTSVVLDALQDSASENAPAIYVHGYYIDFNKGCRRAALLQENASLSNRFIWFSWPSDGDLADYMRDEADLYWSVIDLADAIIELESRFGSGVVDVVGHSLGARGVALALYEVAYRSPDIRLDEIVLLAPDMDFAIFQRLLPHISQIASNITIYVRNADHALALSAQLHGYPRLGEAGDHLATLSGVEMIDLSDISPEGPTGHLYHIYSKAVGSDLSQLLNDGQRAAERRNLAQTGPNSWKMRTAGVSVSD